MGEQINTKEKKKRNVLNNEDTEPWKRKCKWAWLRGPRRTCWVLNRRRFFSINLDYCHYPTCGPQTHRYTQHAGGGRERRSAEPKTSLIKEHNSFLFLLCGWPNQIKERDWFHEVQMDPVASLIQCAGAPRWCVFSRSRWCCSGL